MDPHSSFGTRSTAINEKGFPSPTNKISGSRHPANKINSFRLSAAIFSKKIQKKKTRFDQ